MNPGLPSPSAPSSVWRKLRFAIRKALGRTRFDDLDSQLRELRTLKDREIHQLGVQALALQELQASLPALEDRLVQNVTARIDHQVTAVEGRRGALLELVDRLRGAVEECVSATTRMDKMIVRSIEKGQEIESEVQRRGGRLSESLDALREIVADAVQRLEERHQEWLEAQRITQTALSDQHARIDGQWTDGLANLERGFRSGGERVAGLHAELQVANERERALADQTAHLIEMLGSTRRELAQISTRADERDEAVAERADLQKELDLVREDLEAAAADVEEVRVAHSTFLRWKAASDAEIARLRDERDRLRLAAMQAADSSKGAYDPSFGSPGL